MTLSTIQRANNITNYIEHVLKTVPGLYTTHKSKAIFKNIPLTYGRNEHLEALRPYFNTDMYKMSVLGRGGRSKETSKVSDLLWDIEQTQDYRSRNYNRSLPLILAESACIYTSEKPVDCRPIHYVQAFNNAALVHALKAMYNFDLQLFIRDLLIHENFDK